MKKNIILSIALLLSFTGFSQEFGFGIKAGLSFSKLNGDLVEGESYGYKSGFHVGPSFTFKFTSVFSARVEVLYNQLGVEYNYEGPSYFVLRTSNGSEKIVFGQKDMTQTTFMNYFDIPIQATVRIGETIELFAGVNVLILPGATGGGVLDFNNGSGDSLSVTLDYRYNSDDVGEGADNDVTSVRFNRTNYEVPDRLGAYYDFEEKDGRTWNTFDFGVHAGARVFFNEALYLSGRIYYGFSDVTNNDLDVVQRREDTDQELKFSDDKDQNFSIQISLGFSF